jgi:Ca-activated chloride channel homolog
LLVFSCQAQEPSPGSSHVIQSPTTQLVPIETSVVDKHGDFVGGLTQDSFRILDDGVEEPIQFFAPVEAPAEVLILLETSPAVYLIHNQHLAAAYALVEGLASDDQVALVTYDQSPATALSFTSNKSGLLAALAKTQYTIGMGDLKLYDCLSAVLDWLAGMHGKREIVLITTGLDSSAPSRWEALAQKVRGEDVVIFSVALGGSLRGESAQKPKGKKSSTQAPGSTESPASKSADAFRQADEALRSLAAMTGGRVYFPQSDQDFAPIYREIASAMRHQYVLGIVPAHDNQFHRLTVEMSGGGQSEPAGMKRTAYRVFARSGYLAPGP